MGGGVVHLLDRARNELLYRVWLGKGVYANSADYARCTSVRHFPATLYYGVCVWRRVFKRILSHEPRAFDKPWARGRKLWQVGKVELEIPSVEPAAHVFNFNAWFCDRLLKSNFEKIIDKRCKVCYTENKKGE